MADNRELWQIIMDVPGLSGSWQNRNRQLYEMMGSPLGAYKGNYAQNIMLRSKILENGYYRGGLPGQPAPVAQAPAPAPAPVVPPQQAIADQHLQNIKPNTDIYSEDIMKQNAWFDPFDEWTRNFVNTYMKPEWERDVYNPAMKSMATELGQANQATSLSGAWRTGGARQNLAEMAKNMQLEEDRMIREFQGSTVGTRDAIRTQLAAPLYESNMTRWANAPWRDMNLEGADMNQIRNNLGGTLSGQYLDDLMKKVSTWTPNAGGGGTIRDWQVYPDSPYSPDLYNQYIGRAY